MMRVLDHADADFDQTLGDLIRIPDEDQASVRATVTEIVDRVKSEGDSAVVELTRQFDRREAIQMADLVIDSARLQQAFDSIDPLVADALQESVRRVRHYHEQQLAAMGGGSHWSFEDDLGNRLGQQVRGMQRVGLYAPGGKAAYPSTIIMTAVPARVAGVVELILCVPMPDGDINETLLAAAWLCDVDLVVGIGGAQAIAAMAYGTETVPRVDKIVGPGNIYVATAKELVFGDVGIDMIAGPSEVVIVADDSVDPDWVIQDMFAQAEHDEMAQSILITASDTLVEKVQKRLPDKLAVEPRADIIRRSLDDRGALIHVRDLTHAFDLVNKIAPEHLQLALIDAASYLDSVQFAGAIFLGSGTTEVVGDYTAGPSHVLPTSGTARFASPLGVYDFQVRSSVVECTREGSIVLNRAAAIIADEEGLAAHAESARIRVEG